ncbi:Dps family protein [Polluticaenibacter yanchengensis]|uniref:DNA starvation/stationary phase protection protein n=1 Tax=Polluticaenibacter yanchengensis TaxID=3014562 RepID=A0ABT4UI16_9BACT|nr:DNA starvation/stationary phase protection protein [Chitinophagaceae bacterium LY-5]
MKQTSDIGIEKKVASESADKLNVLLANYSVFYQNVRGSHWNIKGEKFFTLHVKFEELYTDLQLKIDEIAERILTLGHSPQHNYSEYLKSSTVKETKEVKDGNKCVKQIVDGLSVLIDLQRDLLKLSSEEDDEGTNALMSDYIREQEKLIWMYNAFLGV